MGASLETRDEGGSSIPRVRRIGKVNAAACLVCSGAAAYSVDERPYCLNHVPELRCVAAYADGFADGVLQCTLMAERIAERCARARERRVRDFGPDLADSPALEETIRGVPTGPVPLVRLGPGGDFVRDWPAGGGA